MSEAILSSVISDYDIRVKNSMINGVLDDDTYEAQTIQNIENVRDKAPGSVGYFHLRNIYETEGRKGAINVERLKRIATPSKGGQNQGQDWAEGVEGAKNHKVRFNEAFQLSPARAYKRLMDGGDQIYDDLYASAWKVYGSYVKDGIGQDTALKKTFSLLWGDTVLERNGGVEFPNGVGLWHDKEAMSKRGITLNMIEENKVNAFYHITNKYGSQLLFEPYRDMDKNWHEVAQGMLDGGGNVWWTVINDVATDGYRVVVVGQHGDDKDVAAFNTFSHSNEKSSSIEILGDAYYDDGSGPKPIRLTKSQFMDRIGEAAAAEHAYENLDWSDNIHWLYNKDRKPSEWKDVLTEHPNNSLVGDTVRRLENVGVFTPGADMSRRRIKHYIEKLGPGTKHYKSNAKAWSLFDTGFLLDFSDPGRLEIDLFWKPLWDDVQAFERAQETSGEEISERELYELARQRYRSMYKGRNDYGLKRMFSMYDVEFLSRGPNAPPEEVYDPEWRFLKPELKRGE